MASRGVLDKQTRTLEEGVRRAGTLLIKSSGHASAIGGVGEPTAGFLRNGVKLHDFFHNLLRFF